MSGKPKDNQAKLNFPQKTRSASRVRSLSGTPEKDTEETSLKIVLNGSDASLLEQASGSTEIETVNDGNTLEVPPNTVTHKYLKV